jgi:hypothetical protein
VEDVDFLGGVVHVVRQVKLINGTRQVFAPPKGGKERDVPLPESVGFALAAHITRYPPVEITLPWKTLDGPPVTATLVFVSDIAKPLRRHRLKTFARRTTAPRRPTAPPDALTCCYFCTSTTDHHGRRQTDRQMDGRLAARPPVQSRGDPRALLSVNRRRRPTVAPSAPARGPHGMCGGAAVRGSPDGCPPGGQPGPAGDSGARRCPDTSPSRPGRGCPRAWFARARLRRHGRRRNTCGSWSLAWSANSALMCTTS